MRQPDIVGPAGRAWKVRVLIDDADRSPGWVASLGSYVVEVPGAHPFWSFWSVTLVHLRPIDGVRPAVLQFEGAQYELVIFAHDPDHPVCVDIAPDSVVHPLTPPDVCEQFAGVTDEQAADLCAGAVRAIIHGKISPDQDARAAWKELILASVEHMALGGHPVGQG